MFHKVVRYGGILNNHLTGNLPRNLPVIFKKSVKIWQKYGHESMVPLFWPILYKKSILVFLILSSVHWRYHFSTRLMLWGFMSTLRSVNMPPPQGGIKRYRDPSVCLSICLSHGAAVLGYRQAGCLQLSHVRTADPSADGRRSAASRTDIGGGHIVSPPPGR